ncbi:dnaJ homolog subfamily C member 30, mitochondrial [Discoglossus pictus]
MAEVSRRLLGSRAQKWLAPVRGSMAALCVFPVTSEHASSDVKEPTERMVTYGDDVVKSSNDGHWQRFHRKDKKTWASLMSRSQQLIIEGHLTHGFPGSRCFSQGANFRSSYNNNGSRQRASNGAQDVPPLYRSRTAYYDILGVTGSATQSQIKTAYYKQSFLYHPDRNAGSEEAASHFSEISEAYMVLGSVNLRKKYDHGILSWEDVRTAGKPSAKGVSPTRKDPSSQRGASSSTSSRSPTKPMFDFDAFYQAHYGEQLEREQFFRKRREQIQRRKKEPNLRWPFHKLSEISAMFLLLSAIFVLVSLK